MLAPVGPSWTKWVRRRILFLVVGVVKILHRTRRNHPSAKCPLCHYHQYLLPSFMPARPTIVGIHSPRRRFSFVVGGHPVVVAAKLRTRRIWTVGCFVVVIGHSKPCRRPAPVRLYLYAPPEGCGSSRPPNPRKLRYHTRNLA